MALQELLNL
jgi:hypothetical protein